MRYAGSAALVIALASLAACAMFETKEPPRQEATPKVLSVPVGKDWQVTEEAPVLTNERDPRPAFQKEQSVQPEGVLRPVPTPPDKRTIETPR